jgi:hypothetical protein
MALPSQRLAARRRNLKNRETFPENRENLRENYFFGVFQPVFARSAKNSIFVSWVCIGFPDLSGAVKTFHQTGKARSSLPAVVAERIEGPEASPDSITAGCGVWIPGCFAALGLRNDRRKCGSS